MKKKTELSNERICVEALRLIDRHGLDAFSTRKLGLALGCEAMAIYWYYPNKEALLDAVVDQLVVGIAPAITGKPGTRAGSWIEALRRVAHAFRQIAHDHPRAFPLLTTRRFATEGTFTFLEQLFELAREQEIPDRMTARFYRVVSSYCSGFALNEIAAPRAPAALRKRFTRVAEVSVWLEPPYLDEMFDFGLDLLLDALKGKR